MKKGKIKILSCVVVSGMLLTGCVDNMPDMTQEQSELVAEYAATLLLKYSPNYDYRLVDDVQVPGEEMFVEEESEVSIEESSEEITQDNNEVSESKNESIVEKEESQYVNVEDADISKLLEIEEFDIRYTKYELAKMYPKNGAGYAVSAKKNGNLLLVYFDIENLSSESQNCNLAIKDFKIKLNVNETGYVEVKNTLLENDITCFAMDIDPGQKQEVVILCDVSIENEDEINSLSMTISNGADTREIYIK